MIRTWHFYRLSDGSLTGGYFSASSDRDLAANIGEGCGAIEGVTYPHAQRVNIETGELVDYQPQQPDNNHDWNAETRRWQKRADVLERERIAAESAASIAALETKQLRPMRELVIDPDNAGALRRVAEIDSAIAELRKNL